ncbi:hypothetical protein [Arthrobacter sp. H5]|uniref:hypothetical protein n=1 Tax=Arthrobacter sp. H5 TaxID=1267973 RepID=UPI0004876AAF|nr:hypothetical protein [Arthrobacter sp. H5]
MKKYLAPLGITALLLAGCSSPTAAEAPNVDPASPESTAAADSTATETPVVSEPSPLPEETTEDPADARPEGEYSDRGNLVLTPGDGAAITNSEGVDTATFVVNSITVDAPCTRLDAEPAENGHLITLDVSVETLPALAEDGGSFYMDAFGFKPIAANGTTSNLDAGTIASMYCYEDGAMLPSSIGPGEKATGLVVLDVESPSGILVYNDFSSMYGWEWAY